ncbi:histidine kinase [Virgibacillus profundi]|uniref:histidine kinase n=1 Tax=Virgibacillus profundi TaxID=2024555 RepID=A0A2A2I8R4_9BACI|nr:sensor histidine kinase [Virgibacillus profundi]PAV27962.1 histidine kinase [Virgibacillus profundi]PXY52140.1 sensor histidine kinase [Virgibacillus profundi]
MRAYGVWLLFNIIAWAFAMVYFNQNIEELTVRLFGVALYFVIFFIMPLVEGKPKVIVMLLSVNAVIASLSLFPGENGVFNPYLILVLSLLVGSGFYHLSLRLGMIIGIISTAGLLAAIMKSNLSPLLQIFIVILMSFFISALVLYRQTKDRTEDLDVRYDALLSEYRAIRRKLVSEEEIVRQEERMLIAHEIHDSVGHKLTALLMQLEAFRLKASEKDKEKVESLKELASASLGETRNAVKSLKTNEAGGLPGILRLIRKLEMESFIRIHFSVKHGATAAPLTGEQSFVIYRSVQEALTNIMKHSNAREAEIMFEAPGGIIFRFEISNPITDNRRYQEGFGISSIRERLAKFGGDLEVFKTEEQFIVSGFLKIADTGDKYDSDTTG